MPHTLIPSFKNLITRLLKTAQSSYTLFKACNLKATAITIIDLVMQIYPDIWYPYLTYTAIRCLFLTTKYFQVKGKDNRQKIWQAAQLYSTTKVLGIIISQTLLIFLAKASLLSVALVFSWALVLASISALAHHKASTAPLSKKPA